MPPLTIPPTDEWRLRLGALVGTALAVSLALATMPQSASFAAPTGQSGGDGAHYVLHDHWPLPEAPAEPIDLALDADGTLFVADGRSNQVLVYDSDNSLMDAWSDPPTGALPGYVHVPRAVAADSSRGLVYVLWARFRESPPVFEPTGLFLDTRKPDGSNPRPLQAITFMDRALDMAVDPSTGDIFYIGDGRVTRLRMPGRVPIPGFNAPAGAVRIAVSRGGLLALANPAGRRVDLFTLDGAPAGRRGLGEVTPLALAGDDRGNIQVLVRSDRPTDPASPLVVTIDPSGAQVDARSAAEIGAPVPPEGTWPFALALSRDRAALASASSRFQVHRFDVDGPSSAPLIGAPALPAFEPRGEDAAAIGAGLSLDVSASGAVAVLDVKAAQLLEFDGSGDSRLIRGVPDGSVDFALDGAGGAVVTTGDGRLMRLPPGSPDAPATWDVPCDCGLGGRVAVEPGIVHVTRPREQTVESFDAVDGSPHHWVTIPDAVGLWPSDVAVGLDGRRDQHVVHQRPRHGARPRVDGRRRSGLHAADRSVVRPAASGGRELLDGTDVLVAVMGDGYIEMYAVANGNLMARWLPREHDGLVLSPSDIALGRSGEVYLADARERGVFVYGRGSGVPGTPVPSPGPTATPSDLVVHGARRQGGAAEHRGPGCLCWRHVDAGGECPSSTRLIGADIVLVIDRSGSMQGRRWRRRPSRPDPSPSCSTSGTIGSGLASFSTDASIDVPLTDSVPAIVDGLDQLTPDGGTNMAAALERARANLSEFGRAEALPVIVMLSDGQNNDQFPDPLPVAEETRNWGAQIYTVGLGADVDSDTLRAIAGHDGSYFYAPTPNELFPIYGQILRIVLSSLAGNLIIDDEVAAGVEYVHDSSAPPALVSDRRLRWGRSILPSSGLTLTYDVRPLSGGCTEVNDRAAAEYTDADGERRSYTFPVPTVCAVTATPTPTASPTPPATATPTPAAVHLPILYRHTCLPGKAHADVVLLVDTSSSMTGDKLGLAQSAATLFVGLLDFPRDQVAVVGFSEEPLVATDLTRDRTKAEAAIAGLRIRSGTRIDRALWAAGRQLRGPERDPRNRAVIVLMTDGGHAGRRADVLDLAGEVRGMPATIYAIGLGDDADRELLIDVAGHPGRYYFAPTERDLLDIYRQIAVSIPCR